MDIQYQEAAVERKPLGEHLWSLWDVINYMVGNTLEILRLIEQEETLASSRSKSRDENISLGTFSNTQKLAAALSARAPEVTQEDRERLTGPTGTIVLVEEECKKLELEGALDRLERIKSALSGLFVEYGTLATEWRVLREAMHDGLGKRFFYYYPVAKAQRIITLQEDWKDSIAAFKSAKNDIYYATDCYAMGLNNASVYHSMMVLERGLKALCRPLRIKYEHRNWQRIIDEIDDAIKTHASLKGNNSAARMKRLTFYGEAAKEFSHFKEAWRNHTAHGRSNFDENDAKKVLDHVCGFMNTISSRLKERRT